MSTREKILNASQMLFNQRGERNITTNHIAEHLSISPGNLYYHFANKGEIIAELFQQHSQRLQQALVLPRNTELSIDNKLSLLHQVFAAIWEDRFLYRDLEHILDDPKLASDYRTFSHDLMQAVIKTHHHLREGGLIKATDEELIHLSFNAWIVAKNWIHFLRCDLLAEGENLTAELATSGVMQVLALEKPYLTNTAKQYIQNLEYQNSLQQLMGRFLQP